MQYKLDKDLNWEILDQKTIDFGGGFERIVMSAQNKSDIFETDLYEEILKEVESLSGKSYKDSNGEENEYTASFRIIADHIKAAVFIIGDGVIPSNKDQGYILRGYIRRTIRRARKLELEQNFTVDLAKIVIEKYKKHYPNLKENEALIINELEKEEIKFARTIQKGIKELQKITGIGKQIDGKTAFHIYETYGFPIEMIIEEITSPDFTKEAKKKLLKEFGEAKDKHSAKSRAGAEKKFKGGLADTSRETTILHTAHHLLLAALQQVLGDHVKQRGSNITAERLRIDFSHNEKIEAENIRTIENLVNEKIKQGLDVEKKIMDKDEAEKIGAQMEFGQMYGDKVNVYFIGDSKTGKHFSVEFCGGPHVENTAELAEMGNFKIISEKSNGAGVRRIKATLTKD